MSSAALRKTEQPDRSGLVVHLRSLIGQLETTSCGGDLRPLLHECNAELERSLEVERDERERELDPISVTKRELAWLTERLLAAEPAEVAGILRRIRRVLARLDT
jgi:hypothetical protein